MKLGLIGLGRMGANMARRLRKGGIEVSAWNRNAEVTRPARGADRPQRRRQS